jgi:hypothetical protein
VIFALTSAGVIVLQVWVRPLVGVGTAVVLLLGLGLTSTHSSAETVGLLFSPVMGVLACQAARDPRVESGRLVVIAFVPIVQMAIQLDRWLIAIPGMAAMALVSGSRWSWLRRALVVIAVAPTALVSALLLLKLVP